MNIILFDTPTRNQLFPITLTRAVADIRIGILTIKERWAKMAGVDVFVLTNFYLQPKYSLPPAGEYIFIDARIVPNTVLMKVILSLRIGEAIEDENGLIAGQTFVQNFPSIDQVSSLFKNSNPITTVKRLTNPFHLIKWNTELLEFDFNLLTKGRKSIEPDKTVPLINSTNIFIEEGALVHHSVLNAITGPIYIGCNATIMEGCVIRGPFAMGEGAVLKMGTKIYGATTIGPYCMGGGEIKNTIMIGYSNKAHDGYLGDSVIGEWCNLGAGTSNSNVSNTGGDVSLYNYASQCFLPAGNKCGVIMGDYSRTAINTSINTGSVIGVCCNVFGNGLLPSFIPDFTWGSIAGNTYDFDKAIIHIDNWQKMKNKAITSLETQVLKHIFELSNKEGR